MSVSQLDGVSTFTTLKDDTICFLTAGQVKDINKPVQTYRYLHFTYTSTALIDGFQRQDNPRIDRREKLTPTTTNFHIGIYSVTEAIGVRPI